MDRQTGINEEKLNKLILDIYDYSEKINNTLNHISEIVMKTKNCYNSKEAELYRKMYDDYKTNYVNIIKNINSYADDLLTLKRKYINFDVDMKNKVSLQIVNLENLK